MTLSVAFDKFLSLRRFGILLLLPLLLVVGGCSSPEDKAQEFYQKGMSLLQQGDHVKARLELQNALQLQPQMTRAWYAMALIAEKDNDWQKSYAYINKVLELDPVHKDALVKQARLLLVSGKVDKALASSKTLMIKSGEDADVLALHAAVMLKLNDLPTAKAHGEKALEKSPNHIDALAVLASERIRSDDAETALKLANQGIAADNANTVLRLIKIQALNQLSKVAETEAVYKELIALHPGKKDFLQGLGRFYLKQGNKAAAEQQFREIARAHPDDFKATLDLVRLINSTQGGEKAIAEVKQMIEKAPAEMELRFLLASLYMQNNSDQLEPLLNELVASEDRAVQVRAMVMLAGQQMEQGKRAEAQTQIAEILKKDPKNLQARLFKSAMDIDDGKIEAAVADLRLLLKETPDQPKALLLLARAHKFNGQIALADDFYARAFQASKNSPSYGMRYVQFLLKQGKQERAQTVLMDVVRKDPRNQNALTMLARLQIGNGDQRGAQATVDLLRKSNAQKAEELTAAIKADRPEAVDSGVAAMRSSYDATQTKEAMAALVKTYVKAGQKVEAQAFLETVLESSAANNDARLLLGQLHLLNGDYAGAEAAYRQMLVHEPINTQAYLSLAQLYERQQQSDQALQVLNEGLAAVPGDFNLSITKAGQLQRMGQVDEAISLYGALVEQRPDADVVVNNLASLLLDHKGDEESLKRANQLAKRFETSAIPHFRDTLGWSYFKLGDAVKAEPLLRSVVKALPSQAEFRYHLGMVLKANNDLEGARTELTKSLELLGEKSPSYRQYVEQALSEISG